MFSTRRPQKVKLLVILLGEDLRIYFKSKERLGVYACVLVRACLKATTMTQGAKSSLKIKKAFAVFQTSLILFDFVQFVSVSEFLWS